MKNQAIIVFDSGFGGISVLKRLAEAMPNEDYVYYGDSANAPYGPRSKEQVQTLTLTALKKASEECEPKAIVIACNTATAAAKDLAKQAFPDIPVIGILPAVEAAAEYKNHPSVLVLATAGTISSEAYKEILNRVGNSAEVVSLPAPEIVRYVEYGMEERDTLVDNLVKLLSPYRHIRFDCVVLGCTHFPFAQDVVAQALEYPVKFFDGSILTTRQTEEALEQRHARSKREYFGSIRFINSACRQSYLRFAWRLFSSDIKK